MAAAGAHRSLGPVTFVSPPPINESTLGAEANPAQWFAREVHPHDAQLKSYLRGSFPTMHDVDDVVQESYLRLWKVRHVQPIRSAKAFLFTIARHVALDWVRRKRVCPVKSVGDLACLSALNGEPGAAENLTEQEKVVLLGEAIAALPARCREVVLLHKIHGLPQAEVGRRLGLSAKTVENQVARGVKRCTEHMRRRGVEYFQS